MSHLPEVENLVRTAVTEICENKSDMQKCWIVFNAKSLVIQSRVINHPTEVADTLIELLSDQDRRVVLLSMLVLGELKDHPQTHASKAIDRINDIAWNSTDKLLGLAGGLSTALLGYDHAVQWMNNEMIKHNIPEVDRYKKNMQVMFIKEIAAGWK